MSRLQRAYVVRHATDLCLADLARGSGLSEKTVKTLLRERGLPPVDAPRQARLPLLYPQLPRPEARPVARADVQLALAVGAVAFFVYALTCARDITGEDCGELVTAARVLGIAHPPGYPLWCLLAKAFTWIPVGSAVFRVALLSAVAGAGTVSLVALLLTRLTGSRAAAAAGALLLAFSRDLWSQAVIPEVYTLNTFFLAAALYLTWRWYEIRTNGLLFLLAAVLGLSLTNHSTMGPLLVLFGAYVFLVHWTIWREPGLLPLAALAGALPLVVYLYLPIRAEADTIMNWGDPRTLDAFLDHVLRRQYAFEYTAEARSVGRGWQQGLAVARDGWGQVTPWLGWLAIPGAALAVRRDWRFGGLLLGIFGATTLGFVVLLNFPLEREKLTAYRLFYLPAWVIAAIWAGVALAEGGKLLARLRLPAPARLAWAGCALAALPLALHWRGNDKSRYRIVRQYAEAILATLPERAMIVPSGDHSSFPLIYVQGVERRRLDVAVVDKYGYTEPKLLRDMPGALRVGVPRIPPADADLRFQDWLIRSTDRPVYFTNKRSLAGLPGCRLVPEGVLYRLVRPQEAVAPRRDLWDKYDFAALADRPRDYSADVIAAEVLLMRGADKAQRGDKDGARADFAASAEATKGIKQGLNNLGSACAELGLAEDARRYFEAAIALDPGYPTARRNLVRVLMTLRKWGEARKLLDALVAEAPKDLGLRLQLADLLRASGQGRLAIFELEKLAKENPKDPAPLVAAGDLSLEEGDALGALTYYQRALTLDPGRMDLLEKVQQLLHAPARPGVAGDPFRSFGHSPVPRPPDPLEGLRPPGYGTDPFDPRRRR